MTHPLGSGTVNIAVNVPTDERSFWGQMAFRQGKSVADLQRKYALKGLEIESAEDAAKLRDIRKRYYGVFMLGVFVIGIAFDTHLEARRSRCEERVEEVREAA